MNKPFFIHALTLFTVAQSFLLSGAASRYPKAIPLYTAAVALDAQQRVVGERYLPIPSCWISVVSESLQSAELLGSRSIETALCPIMITLIKNRSNCTQHIGISAGDVEWGMSELSIPKEAIAEVHNNVKYLLENNRVDKLDTASAKDHGGSILSCVVHANRRFYQKYDPVVVTFNSKMPIKAPSYQFHLAFAEYLSDSSYGYTGRGVYTELPVTTYKPSGTWSIPKREDKELLTRLMSNSHTPFEWSELL